MIKSKRGIENISAYILVGLLMAVLLSIPLILFINKFSSTIGKSNADCLNKQWWDSERGLKNFLKQVDNNGNGEFFFENSDCNLVSFSFVQGLSKSEIIYPQSLPKEPILCLCKLDSTVCKEYGCYKFSNYDQINEQQFSTKDLGKYVSLKFTKDGRTLRIDAIGTVKKTPPVIYEKKSQSAYDKTGLIENLVISFSTPQITSFNPFVDVKNPGFLIPVEITNIEGFTKFFEINLAQLPAQGQTDQDYLMNHKDIDINLVKAASITLNLDRQNYLKLTDLQRKNIYLYYKKENQWINSSLTCIDVDNKILCNTVITGFSNSFAVSSINK